MGESGGLSAWGGKRVRHDGRLTLCNYWIYCVYCFLFVSFLLLPTRVLVLFALRTMPGTSYCSVNICGMNDFPDEGNFDSFSIVIALLLNFFQQLCVNNK